MRFTSFRSAVLARGKFGLSQVGPPRSSQCSEVSSAFGGMADMADLFWRSCRACAGWGRWKGPPSPPLPVVPICRIRRPCSQPQITGIFPRIPSHQRGVAHVTDVGCGMRWTRRRRKTSDADPPSAQSFGGPVPGPSSGFFERRARTAKSCGPDAPTLASSSREEAACDGGKKARSPGRARRKPLKPLRGECRVIPV